MYDTLHTGAKKAYAMLYIDIRNVPVSLNSPVLPLLDSVCPPEATMWLMSLIAQIAHYTM